MLERLQQPISFKRAPRRETTAPPARPARKRGASLPARRQKRTTVVGLDIEPGQIVAVEAHIAAGRVVVDHAAGAPLAPDVVRDGEVNDVDALVSALSEMFSASQLDRRVRIGIANQRIVMRRIELPPITNAKEIAAAVRFHAADEIPMPLESVVLDYHTLGIVETPAGPRLQTVLVAARRDMVERVLRAARLAGLRPEGVDLSAFAMIRALHTPDTAADEHVLYLSVGGITNLAVARGATCEFTRVIGTGVEQIVGEVAARCGVVIGEARRLLIRAAANTTGIAGATAPSFADDVASDTTSPVDHERAAASAFGDGVRRIAAEVRNSLDFHLAQGENRVSRAVLCGPALDLPGFELALSAELGIPVAAGSVALAGADSAGQVPPSRLVVAAGLAIEEGAS